MPSDISYKLNSFQRAALSWDRTLPYNAAHVVRVSGRLDGGRLEKSIYSCLERYGLSGFHLDEDRSCFRFKGPARAPLEVLSPAGVPPQDLKEKLEAELNRPFDRSRPLSPFRFFVLSEGGGFHLGLVYFHVIADAGSIIHLLEDIVNCYESGRLPPLDDKRLYPRSGPGLAACLRDLAGWLWALPADIADVSRARRTNWDARSPKRTGLLLERVDLDGVQLAGMSRKIGVTLNDVFLAALLRAGACLRPPKDSGRRDRVSVGSIVSTRRDIGLNGGREFGLFLSSFRVSAARPEKYSVDQMAACVRRQTSRVKRHRLHLRNSFETSLGLRLERFNATASRDRFYAKNYPLTAGLTNIDLRKLWRSAPQTPVPDYWRAVSTSSPVPMVFSVTSAGPSLNISVSFSTHVYTPTEARETLSRFTAGLREFAGR